MTFLGLGHVWLFLGPSHRAMYGTPDVKPTALVATVYHGAQRAREQCAQKIYLPSTVTSNERSEINIK